MSLPGARWAEKDHILSGGHKVQGAQMGDLVTFQAAGVIEVELFKALAGRESGGLDAALAAVRVPGCDLALQTGGQILLMGPRFRAGSLGEPIDRLAQRGRFQRPGEESQFGGQVPAGRHGLGGRHQAAPSSAPVRSPSALS